MRICARSSTKTGDTANMGFSFRGKASKPPVTEGQATGADLSPGETIDINPEADLKKFQKLHKWDPFMEIDKLDAADEFVALLVPRKHVETYKTTKC